MLQQPVRRFYREAAAVAGEEGWELRLDGRAVKTPARQPLRLPRAALAEALAAEWAAQGEKLQPAEMPLTALTFTAVDLVRPRRAELVAEIADYGGTDLLCYRAAHPPELVERQRALWQPLLDWAALALDAQLLVTEGVTAVEQPAAALQALRGAVEAEDDFALAALATSVRASGSLVIGLALAQGRLDAEAAFAAAELDESWELERWGEDAEAAKRRAGLLSELQACERFFALLRE